MVQMEGLEFEGEKTRIKARTSLRMRYEAEASHLAKQLGSLSEIQERIGLSGHKLCKLLLVDPSAWSRWNKVGKAPPYVYRALQWYLLLEDKYPGLGPQTFLVDTTGAQAKAELEKERQERKLREAEFLALIQSNEENQKNQYLKLKKSHSDLKKQIRLLLAISASLSAALIGLLIYIN